MNSKEVTTIKFMIELYCRKKHGSKKLCPSCFELFSYAKGRIESCKHKSTFCSLCNTPCYNKEKRENIKKVMRFSGPKMLLYNPPLAVNHIILTIKHKRKKK